MKPTSFCKDVKDQLSNMQQRFKEARVMVVVTVNCRVKVRVRARVRASAREGGVAEDHTCPSPGPA